MTAKIRVEGRGACYIPSNEIAQLPEVKEMQHLAAIIVRKDMEENKIMSNIEKLECIRESLEAFEIMSYKATGHLIMLQEVIDDLRQSEFDIEAQGVEKFATWALEQQSFALEAGDKKEARIYCHVSARAKHFAKSLLEGKI